jgi:hypothetical protein
MRKSTVMPRKMECKICGYTQEDYTSYYKHSKAWAKGHDLDSCLSIRRANDSFDKMFNDSLTSLSNLTINK